MKEFWKIKSIWQKILIMLITLFVLWLIFVLIIYLLISIDVIDDQVLLPKLRA